MNWRSIFVGSAGIRAGWSAAIFMAIVFALSFIARLILAALHLRGMFGGGELPPTGLLASHGPFIVVVGIATFIMSRIEGKPFLSYGFVGPDKLARFLWGLLSGFVALSALIGILALGHLIVFDKVALSGAPALGYAIAWLVGFMIVGIAEETMFRGYLLFTLSRGLNFFWAAVIMSIFFGAIHSTNAGETPVGVFSAGVIGFVFCFSIWLTGSLYWAIGIHAAWDWAQSYLFGVADSGLRVQYHLLETHPAGNIWLSGGATGPEGSVFVFLIMLLVALGLYLTWGRTPAFGAQRRV
jgi:membrane protease YdiL (CAAX protease family)